MPLKIFLAIALILPEMTSHAYLHTCLFVAIPLRCQIYKVKSIVKFIDIAPVPRTWLQVAGPSEYLLEIEGKNNMRGRYHFHSFIGEEAKAERYTMPHTTDISFSLRKGVIVLIKITYIKTMH